jgi:hypothetical protein
MYKKKMVENVLTEKKSKKSFDLSLRTPSLKLAKIFSPINVTNI